MIERLLNGIDENLFNAILGSGRWQGTKDELAALVRQHTLKPLSDLPIREAIDWVHTSIYSTNQAMKFSLLPDFCGGPIEIAVVTTDRPFRWIRHKKLDAAIDRYGNSDGS